MGVKNPETVRVMFVGTQVDTISCKGADSVCCPFFVMVLASSYRPISVRHRDTALEFTIRDSMSMPAGQMFRQARDFPQPP